MANILRARQKTPFGWHYTWVPLDNEGKADIKHTSALKQPETIKIRWDHVTASDNISREVSADLIPDKGIFGCEFAMIHTFPMFDSLIWKRLNKADDKYVTVLYDLMGRCFQGKALTKWSKAIGTVADTDRTEDTFKESRINYFENVSETKNLGDCLIR